MAEAIVCASGLTCRQLRHATLLPSTSSIEASDDFCTTRIRPSHSFDLSARNRYGGNCSTLLSASGAIELLETCCLVLAPAVVESLPSRHSPAVLPSRRSVEHACCACRSSGSYAPRAELLQQKSRRRSLSLQTCASQAAYAEPHVGVYPSGPPVQPQGQRGQPGPIWTALVLLCATVMTLAGACTAFILYIRPVLKVCQLLLLQDAAVCVC